MTFVDQILQDLFIISWNSFILYIDIFEVASEIGNNEIIYALEKFDQRIKPA